MFKYITSVRLMVRIEPIVFKAAPGHFMCLFMAKFVKTGLVRDLNPGPLAPKARIMPLDQRASWTSIVFVIIQ